MRARAAYDELIRRVRQASLLSSCAELLGWDEETYMPRAGAAHRAEQLALLAGMLHQRNTDPRLGELLDTLEGSELVRDPEAPEAVNVRELRRVHSRAGRLPRALVEETARVTSLAQQEWAAALRDADFPRFRPWLDRVVVLKRREAEVLGYEDVAYDALLEEYEPGARGKDLTSLFDSLERDLIPLANALTHAERQPDGAVLRRCFPVERQRVFGEMAAAAVGFDFGRGRLDTTTHPFFSTVGPHDCRLTTRFDAHFSGGFFGTLHEAGHGLYEQGLDPGHHGTPMGEAPSLALHESQSRLWENTVGRSRPFWVYFFPLARCIFREVLGDVNLETFYGAVNRVGPTHIRVQADEVTYNLHILMRFRLEQALLAGDLKAADVPETWNEVSRHYLGIVPGDDAEGCLQDGHWAAGLIGYFPTYTLGNLFAAQLFDRAEEELGGLDRPFARGDFAGLLGWLRDRVYRQGQRYPAAALIERATGSPPDHRPFVRALHRKYGELYGI